MPDDGTARGLEDLERAWRDGLRPEPFLTVSEWADTHRVLPLTAPQPGPWRTSRRPYLREPMDCLSAASRVEKVVVMKGSGIGATEMGNCWIGYVMQHAPGGMILLQETLAEARNKIVPRVEHVIESTHGLEELLSSAPTRRRRGRGKKVRRRDSSIRKDFRGGYLMFAGARTPAAFRSEHVRYAFGDEVETWPADVDGEGDPVDLLERRTVDFKHRRKVLLISTPKIKLLSRIERAFLKTDQRRFFVPCKHCGVKSVLRWENFDWPRATGAVPHTKDGVVVWPELPPVPEDRPELAYWWCPECGCRHHEGDKATMLAGGEWRPTAPDPSGGRVRGYHLPAFYSPLETWGDQAQAYVEACANPEQMQVWVNTIAGETFEDLPDASLSVEGFAARQTDLGPVLPEWVVLLVAGIDVHPDRVEVQVLAIGAGKQVAVWDYRVLWGDLGSLAVQAQLDALLQRTYRHARAVPPMGLRAVCIDAGFHGSAVYDYCTPRFDRRIWAVRGSKDSTAPIWSAGRPRRRRDGRIAPFWVGTVAAKDWLFSRLRIAKPGPGYIHFHVGQPEAPIGPAYFDQLTAERVVTVDQRGRPCPRRYVKKFRDARNEALDTFVYAVAALYALLAMGLNLDAEDAELAAVPLRADVENGVAQAPPRPGPWVRKTYRSQFMSGGS